MIMEKTGYYIYPTVPGSIYAFKSDARGRTIKDVALNNTEVDRLRIAEMTLNVTSVAAITDDNTEHTFLRFEEQNQIKLHVAKILNKKLKITQFNYDNFFFQNII